MTTIMMLAMALGISICIALGARWNTAVALCRQAGLSRPCAK
jgi:isoprenylcysteine carboxyl methyltransferase (ICMT) family protein YpbQ